MSEISNGNAVLETIELFRSDGSSTKHSNPTRDFPDRRTTDGNEEVIGIIFEDDDEKGEREEDEGKAKKEEEEEEEKCPRTSASICDVSSVLMEEVYRCSSPSCLSSYRSKKEQRSISDPRASLQASPRRTIPTRSSAVRRSTIVSLPNPRQAHPSIVEPTRSSPLSNTAVFYTNFDSDEIPPYGNVHTRIKLSLPSTSSSRQFSSASRHAHHRNTIATSEPAEGLRTGEFILPTNPPITVTIEPQDIDFDHPCHSIHDDQICSSTSLINERQRTSLDPSIKAGSTIVTYFMDLLKPSDNKLAMKLFGSRKGLLKERLRQQRAGHCIIHPCSNFRFYWDLIMLVLLITNVIVLPVAIAFFSDEINSARWIIFNVVSDTFFLFDIVVNFRTGVLRNDYMDEIILEPRLIAKNYFKTWFVVDLFSSLPVDYLFLFFDTGDQHSGGYTIARTGRAIKVLRLVKLLSLLRLLRLSRLVRYIHQWEEFLSIASMVMRILNLIALIILLAHWNGCLQFMIPMFQNFPTDCWVSLNGLQTAPWTEQYTVALFKALSHMLCIGYGRYPPQSYVDMWLTMLSMVIGAMCYAVTIGHVSALVQSFDTSRRLYNEKYKQVEEYMAWRKLPREMRNRISDYYEHRYQGKIFHEDTILQELSETLRLDVINYNCRALVSSVPFFSNADPNFVSDVVTKLRFEVFQPADQIISEGTIGEKMYFIQEGIVDIIKSDGTVLTTLSDGSYFGEICLLTRAKRVASVRCVTYCNLYSLDASQFETVLDSYPLMRRTMESVAAERLNKLGKNPSIISTRHDLKRDAAVLKDIIDRNTPLPSTEESSTLTSDNEDQQVDIDDEEEDDKQSQSSIWKRHLPDRDKRKKSRRKSSTDDQTFKKLSRLFLAAPSAAPSTSTLNDHRHQMRKSPSTPWSLFKKNGSPTPSLPNPTSPS